MYNYPQNDKSSALMIYLWESFKVEILVICEPAVPTVLWDTIAMVNNDHHECFILVFWACTMVYC